jgi:hypothetical protein
MRGTITSKDPTVNEHGVSFLEVVQGKLDVEIRLNVAFRNALHAWREWVRMAGERADTRAKQGRPSKQELDEAFALAVEMTDRALL